MKARDLAALAALGIAGKMAYDKFGRKKDDEPTKKKMGEGLDMTNQGAMVRATRSQSDAGDVEMGTKGAYLPETAELRTKGAYLDDTPEFRTKGAYLDERATPAAKAAAPAVVKKKDVVEAVAPAPKTRAFTPPGAQDSMGAFTTAGQAATQPSEYADVVPKGDLGSQDFRSNAKRLYDLNEASGAANPASLLTDTYGNLSRAEKHVDVTKKRAEATPLIAKSSALANVSHATQAAAMARKRAAEQQAKMNDIARLDALNKSNFTGGRRAKGGVVKMASGGMTSSKMSKPSGASRGDGIAQRGRTRGTLR